MEKFKRLQNIFKGDRIIWIIFFMLCLISVVEVYSSSARLGYKTGNYWFAATYHSGSLIIGFVCMLAVLNTPCRYFKLLTPFLFIASIGMLIFVYLIGTKENDAARWLKLGFISIQPSEIAKGTLVLTTAHILSQLQTPTGVSPKAFKYILGTSAALIGLVLPENFSTAALMGLVVLVMMFVGRVSMKQLFGLIAFVAATMTIAASLIMLLGKSGNDLTAAAAPPPGEHEYMVSTDTATVKKQKRGGILHRMDLWKSRIETFLDNKKVPPEQYDMQNNEQVARAYIAIASSDVVGRGPGRSVQRDLLPLAFSDFIYAIIFEEFGLIGAALVAFLYIILLFRTGTIAQQCENTFPALLAMGLALMIVEQALFNMCVAVGLAPVTGQTLPLISKGGTSCIINCIYIGVILSVSRTAKKKMKVEPIGSNGKNQKEIESEN